jgi:tRNA pseudouridine32 synthase/23S rRNA pseudouridine746 synthase
MDINVLYADARRAILYKPPGLSVDEFQSIIHLQFALGVRSAVGDARKDDVFFEDTGRMRNYVHRLDRHTSGCLVFACTRSEARRMSNLFRDRKVDKTYYALVQGSVRKNEGRIDLPLKYDFDAMRGIHLSQVSDDGKPSLSTFEVIARSRHATLLALHPHTGRMHQLRVHCASIGHPIIGDDFYKPKAVPPLCLHAGRIAFADENDRKIEATAPPPDYFARRIQKIWGKRLAESVFG